MKSKFFVLILMATVLLIQHSNAQSSKTTKKIKSLNDKVFFGKKSYNYKSFGKQNIEENLKKAKERLKNFSPKTPNSKSSKLNTSARKKADYSNNVRRKKKGNYKGGSKYNRYNDDTHYYPEKFYAPERFYGFSYHDFGHEAAFDANLERADYITENMDRILDLSRNQAYDVFRLNVLFISDMNQLMYGSNTYAHGANYGGHHKDYHIKDLITENYLNALEEILRNSQERRLDKYFRRYDLMGNSQYDRYNSYSDRYSGSCGY